MTPYEDGGEAFRNGAQPENNPHAVGTPEYSEWLAGYWDTCEDINQ